MYQTRALLVELQRKNLLQLHEGALGFHDLQQDYLRIAVDDLPALHGALLAAYEKELPAGPAPDRWASLPKDEPYLWRNLTYLAGDPVIERLHLGGQLIAWYFLE